MKPFFSWLWDGWMKFAHIVGEVNQFILLGIIYFVVVGIYAILFWPFTLFTKSRNSSWNEAPKPQNLDQLTRPF